MAKQPSRGGHAVTAATATPREHHREDVRFPPLEVCSFQLPGMSSSRLPPQLVFPAVYRSTVVRTRGNPT